ncbi:hypothetical protein [Streptomyces sp. SS1-1]|nr:hypothetical protein [Streptomyces sp. SS1-1]
MILILALAVTAVVAVFALFLHTLRQLAETALHDTPPPTRDAHNNQRHP